MINDGKTPDEILAEAISKAQVTRLIDKKTVDAKRVCQPILVKREEQVQHDEQCTTCGVLSVAKLAHSPTPFASSSPRQSLRHGRNPKCAQIFLLVQ